MKRLFLLLVAAALTACNGELFTQTAPEATGAPIVPMRLVSGAQQAFLTDYLPSWEGADSLTVADGSLTLKALKEDWSEFEVVCPEQPLATTIDAWKDGLKCSIVALHGGRDSHARIFSAGQLMRMVAVEASVRPTEIVAMWQNCRLEGALVPARLCRHQRGSFQRHSDSAREGSCCNLGGRSDPPRPREPDPLLAHDRPLQGW